MYVDCLSPGCGRLLRKLAADCFSGRGFPLSLSAVQYFFDGCAGFGKAGVLTMLSLRFQYDIRSGSFVFYNSWSAFRNGRYNAVFQRSYSK